jgi:hypothetical protein
MQDVSELLDDLPGPGDVLDALDDSRGDLLDTLDDGSLGDLLDVLDTGEGKTRSQQFSPIPNQTDD